MFINDSNWWRDLVTLDSKEGLKKNIFSENIVCYPGDGRNIAFLEK